MSELADQLGARTVSNPCGNSAQNALYMIATDPGGDQPVGNGEIGTLEEQALVDTDQEVPATGFHCISVC